MKYELFDSFGEMRKYREEMDKMMEDFFKNERAVIKGLNIKEPSIDIENKKKELEITADLPGIDKKNLEVCIDKDRVEIKAKKNIEKDVKGKDYYKQERSYTGFYRSFSLPAIVNPDKAKLTFRDGILRISMPKLKEISDKPKRLMIK